MHECINLEDWVRHPPAATDPKHRISRCPRCSEARSDLDGWAGAIAQCPDCRSALDNGVPSDDRLACPHCLEALQNLHDMLETLDHFDPSVLAEANVSEARYRELLALEPENQVRVASTDLRYHLWTLCQRFVSEAQGLWHREPHIAAERARVGAVISDRLDEVVYHSAWVANLRAKAHGYLANCLRILARFSEAEREFKVAYEHLARGTDTGLWEARILSLEATLRIDQNRYDEAARLLDQAEAFYLEHDDRQGLGRTQIKRARVYDLLDQHHAAAEECVKAHANLDPERSPSLSMLASQNRVYHLVQSGEMGQARHLFGELPPTSEPMFLVRRKWIEADLLRAESKLAHAIEAYEDARRGFAAAGLTYDVALVSLDQALTAYEMGDFGEMDRLVGAASLLLIEAGARREALAASQILLSTIERGNVNPGMFTAIHRRVAALRPS